MRTSGRSSFDISVFNTSGDTDRFHTMIRDMWTRSVQAEPTALHMFMDRLAQHGRLLRHYTQNVDCIAKPLLVTSGPREIKSQRCGLPRKQTYAEDSEFLYLIYDSGDDHGEGLTSFFIRQSVFFAFYGRHPWPTTNSATCGSSIPQDVDHNQAQEAFDHREEDTDETSTSVGGRHDLAMIQSIPQQHALHQETLEQERRTQARLNQERQEQERLERLEQEWQR